MGVDGDQRLDVPTGSAWVLDPTLPTIAAPTVQSAHATHCSAHWACHDHNAHYTMCSTQCSPLILL